MSAVASKLQIRDRYEVQSVLRDDGPASTYLAQDLQDANQLVVVRSILPPASARDPEQWLESATLRARLVGSASHPCLAPIVDAWTEKGRFWIAWSKVPGKRLDQMIRRNGGTDPVWALRLTLNVAQALEDLHEAGALHERVRPANVLVGDNGHPCLLDAGLAHAFDTPFTPTRREEQLRDARPGAASGKPAVPWADLVGLAAMAHSMISAKAFRGQYDASGRLLPLAPGQYQPLPDMPGLAAADVNQLLSRSLRPGQDGGIVSVADFVVQLQSILNREKAAAADAGLSPMDRILKRIRSSRDFPALTETIAAVNRTANSDLEPMSVLCNCILRDYGLTARLLRMVNASHLRHYGGDINSISRSVSIVGVNTVRNIAVSLMLFEHLQGRANLTSLKDEIAGAYFSGLLAREMHLDAGIRDGEEAFVCALFQRFGHLLVKFHLPDEAAAIASLTRENGGDEPAAARHVLEVELEDIGVAVAQSWNLSEDVRACMRHVTDPGQNRAVSVRERLRNLATLTNAVVEEIKHTDLETRDAALDKVVSRHGPAIGVARKLIMESVQDATQTLIADAKMLGYSGVCANFARRVAGWNDKTGVAWDGTADGAAPAEAPAQVPAEVLPLPEPAPDPEIPATANPDLASAAAMDASALSSPESSPDPRLDAPRDSTPEPGHEPPDLAQAVAAPDVPADTAPLAPGDQPASPPAPSAPEAAAEAPAQSDHDPVTRPEPEPPAAPNPMRLEKLARGLREVVDMVAEDRELPAVLRATLAAMQEGGGFDRVLLFMRDPKSGVLRCRMGCGDQADKLAAGGFEIRSTDANRDLFYPATVMGADLCLTDLEEPRLRPHVPPWFRDRINARGLILLPLVIRKRTLGLIYADALDAGVLRFSDEEFSMLKSMRNQAMMALRIAGQGGESKGA